jgi:hypothetical protein
VPPRLATGSPSHAIKRLSSFERSIRGAAAHLKPLTLGVLMLG